MQTQCPCSGLHYPFGLYSLLNVTGKTFLIKNVSMSSPNRSPHPPAVEYKIYFCSYHGNRLSTTDYATSKGVYTGFNLQEMLEKDCGNTYCTLKHTYTCTLSRTSKSCLDECLPCILSVLSHSGPLQVSSWRRGRKKFFINRNPTADVQILSNTV